jgi:predicted metalloprotease
VLATVAHEFGHVMQYDSGKYDEIAGNLPTGQRIELHADFMAGYYIGVLKKQNPTASFWKAGDKFRQIGTYDDKNPYFHGTPEQRVASSQQGFTFGYYDGRSASEAFRVGTAYVSSIAGK